VTQLALALVSRQNIISHWLHAVATHQSDRRGLLTPVGRQSSLRALPVPDARSHSGICTVRRKLELGIIDSNWFGMANRKPTGSDSAVVTSSGRFNRGHGTKPCSRLFSVSFCGSVFAQVY